MRFVDEPKVKFLLSQGREEKILRKKIKCESKDGFLSNAAWCDLKTKADVLKLHDKCPISKNAYQEQIFFTLKQLMLEGIGFRRKMTETFN